MNHKDKLDKRQRMTVRIRDDKSVHFCCPPLCGKCLKFHEKEDACPVFNGINYEITVEGTELGEPLVVDGYHTIRTS